MQMREKQSFLYVLCLYSLTWLCIRMVEIARTSQVPVHCHCCSAMMVMLVPTL